MKTLIVCLFTTVGLYAKDPTPFKQISADQAQDGNPAAHAFDDDPGSRWSAQGRGRWIQVELTEARELSELGVGFHNGERDYAFDIRVSMDGRHWSEAAKFQSKGRRSIQTYAFSRQKARFVRLTSYGSNKNDWNNVHSIRIPGLPAIKASTVKAAPVQAGGFVITEWAKHPELANGVAISIDDQGRAWVAKANRRKQSSLDIRHHQDLVKKDLSLTTVEDRRRYYREDPDLHRRIPDRNQDGKKDWRDLTVQKDAVYMAADEDGDGSAERIKLLGEYHSEVTGIAAGVVAVGSDVFVCAEPDFLRYHDEDGDGFPETEQRVSTGYQVHMGQGGHNLSGAVLGPDGRVYWSLADKGHHVVTKEGRTYHRPNSGAIFRCELDGSMVERFSSGERNAQELAFDAHGNLFSMDNDGDYPGEKERALYITEGSEHGWRLNWQWMKKQDFIKISGLPPYNPWMAEKLFLPDHETHAAYLTPTIGNFGPGPCGFTANPGTALSEALADRFFMTNQKAEVRVFSFAPKGAFFAFKEHAAIKGGVSNTGLAIGPDGALYAANYNNRGVIYRFDVEESQRHPLRAETQKILAQDSSKASVQTLQAWLDHADQRVRMKGQFALVRRGGVGYDAFNETLAVGTPLGKLHAVWGIGQAARAHPPVLSRLAVAWTMEDPEVIAQAAKVCGDVGTRSERWGEELRAGLDHASPRVRFFAAIALGKRKDAQAVPGLIKLLETSGRSDPYLRHAAVMGLRGAMQAEELARLAEHASRSVRLGAVVALRRQAAPEVRAFLDDDDELVLLETARAIHDDYRSIPDALPDLAALLAGKDFQNEALMRRVINAALRNGFAADLERLEGYLAAGKGTTVLRRTALASILWWATPPVLDPVEGRYRKHAERDIAPVHAAIQRLNPVILADPELSEVLLNGVRELGHAQWLSGASAHFAAWPGKLQHRLLEAMAKTKDPGLKHYVAQGLASKDRKVQATARGLAGKVGIPTTQLLIDLIQAPGVHGKGQAVTELARLKDPKAQGYFDALVAGYRKGSLDPAIRFEVWQAAKERRIELPAGPDRLARGGNPVNGKKLVLEHPAAQCIRCHLLGTVGSNLGPPLSRIGAARKPIELVASMLEPNREISEGYGAVSLKTSSGRELAGVLVGTDGNAWKVQLGDGTVQRIEKKDIVSQTLTSTMPPMGALLKESEIRDVVSYLSTLK